MTDFINQIHPWIDHEEKEQLLRVIDSTYVTEAGLTKEFEDIIKTLTGSKYAISMTNGTAALYCCMKALGIGPGDEVIVPDMTFIATANAVIMTGATPILCDVSSHNLSLSPSRLKRKLSSKTKAIIPVHLYGGAADLESLRNFCQKYGVYMIEDAAQGVGVRYNDRHVGTFGDLGILSFYGNKTVTCGEGGIVLTNNEELAKECYRLKNHGRDEKGIFIHDHIGYNFAFTEMQAAIGIAQMNKLERIIEKKKQIYDRYISELSSIEEFVPLKFSNHITPVYWFTSFFTEYKNEFAEFMKSEKIQTRQFFYPLHRQPCYKFMGHAPGVFENSNNAFETGISLPSAYDLTDQQQGRIIDSIRKFFDKRGNQ
jgi:perosamine synthetase